MTQPNQNDNIDIQTETNSDENLIVTSNKEMITDEDLIVTSTEEVVSPSISKTPSVSMNQKVDKLGDFSLNILRSLGILRLSGYVLLILFFMDAVEILVPPRFLNPEWEFQTIGQFVERVPIPLISLLFIFYGGKYLRKGWESIVLFISSWLTLLIGILFLIAVPLGIINTFRIDNTAQTNITEGAQQRLEVFQQVEDRLDDVQTTEQMQVLIAQLNSGNAPRIENNQQLELAKTELTQFIEQSRNRLNRDAEARKGQARRRLLKSSVKWNVGALISGVLFIVIWKMTKWARVKGS